MLSSNNRSEMLKKQAQKHQRFTIKKLSVGVASVLIGLTFMGVSSVSADANDQSDAASPTAVVSPADGTQTDAHVTSNQPVNETSAVVANGTNTQAAATNASQSTELKTPDYYNITVNFHDDTRGADIQVLNRNTGHYEYRKPYVYSNIRPNEVMYQIRKVPIAGYKLLNPEALDQYFDFDTTGHATVKKGLIPQDTKELENGKVEGNINVTLHYAVLSPIKLQYVDADSGHVLASFEMNSYRMVPESPRHKAGDVKSPDASKYEGAAINIPGYKLVSAPLVEGRIDGQTQNSWTDKNYITLTFKYKKVMDGEESPTTTPSEGAKIVDQWVSVPGMFNVSGVYGTKVDGDNNGNVEQRTKDLIDRYKKQGFSYLGTTNKLYNDDYFNYYATGTSVKLLPNKAVQVNYVDEHGNKLADSDTLAFNAANPDQTNQGINPSANWYAAGEWTAKPKNIAGYHLVKTQGATKGEFTAFDYTTTFVYAKDQGSVIVKVHDNTDNKDLDNYTYNTGDQDVDTTVSYDKDTTIAKLEQAGYKVLNPEVVIPTSITKGTQTVTIYVEHDTVKVTPDQPADPSDPVNPANPDSPKFPDGTYADQLNHTYTRTINYLDEKTNKPVATPVVQTVTAKRTALVDKVTGELKGYLDAQGNLVTGDGWISSQDGWNAVTSPKVDGYQTPTQTEVPATKINPSDPSTSQTVTVYYTPQIIDPDTPTDPTKPTDPTTPTTPETPETPVNPQVPGEIIDNDQPGQPAVPNQTSQQDTPAKGKQNAQQLPQTGNNNQAAVLGLGMGAVAGLLGLLGMNKKREN